MSFVTETARRIPVFREVDVLVVGGGPTGIMAAAAAARQGLSSLLIERSGFLGGAGTAGGLSTFCGLHSNVHGEHVRTVGGMVPELLDRIDKLGGLRRPHLSFADRIMAQAYDIPAYRLAADQLVLASGAEILFHTFAVGLLMKDDAHIDAVIVETKEGRFALRARFVIDASGDADVAYWSGAEFEKSPPNEMLYPSTMFRINNVDGARAGAAWKTLPQMMDAAVAAGREPFPRRGAIVRPQRDDIEWRANATQLRTPEGLALDGTRIEDLSAGEIQGRQQAQEVFEFIRDNHAGFERSYIVDIGPEIGIRETRRIVGAYQLTEEDVLGGVDFDDAIGINGWPVEAHVDGNVEIRWPHGDAPRGYSQLPYRIMVAPAVSNLLVGGRGASMTHGGHSAARVSGPCFAMGHAAGVAAAIALEDGVSAASVDIAKLQSRLAEQEAILEVKEDMKESVDK
ncbi:FAD-dependent oxidoreductase [Citricoccus parietis]|uniref:FAD-dependent oxidoreductase n=2 Tax=Citricoccus parietis TaxID=592307 RepID=A0ABV6F1M0_9MICC